MFSISSKSTYAIIALIDLAGYYNRGLVKIKDIVERCKIPRNYLEQILNLLSKCSIINGVRGNAGGYVLSRNPDAIALLDILEAIEGRLQIVDSKYVTATQSLFDEVENRIRDSLNISLSELVSRQRKGDRLIDFQI